MTGPEPTMDELVELAGVAHARWRNRPYGDMYRAILTAVLPRVLKGEREACAKVADDKAKSLFESYQFPPSQTPSVERMRWTQACRKDTALDIANAIRARSVHSHIESLIKGET